MLPLTLAFKYLFIIPWKAFWTISFCDEAFFTLNPNTKVEIFLHSVKLFLTSDFQFLSMTEWMSSPTNNLHKWQACHLHHNDCSGNHCTDSGQWGTWGTSTSLQAAWDEKSLQWGRWPTEQRLCQSLILLPVRDARAPRKLALGVWTKGRKPDLNISSVYCILIQLRLG